MSVENPYEIVRATAVDVPGMVETQARSFEAAYVGLGRGTTPEKLKAFVDDESPTGFRTRIRAQWEGVVGGDELVPGTRDTAFVAQERSTSTVVGLVATRRNISDIPRGFPHDGCNPMEHWVDRITALYVDPNHQSRRLGSWLLQVAMSGLDGTVVLETVRYSRAVEFYTKHGFEERTWIHGLAGPSLWQAGILLPRRAMCCHSNPYNPKLQLSSAMQNRRELQSSSAYYA